MNYDHVLLPSGAATTLSEVDAYLTAQQGLPQSAAVAAMAGQINERNAALPEEDAFLADNAEVGGGPTGDVLHVACPYDAIGHVRALLFELATPRGYAVYDPQLAWLLDPAGHVPVTVTHGGADEFPYLTEALVRQWVPELADPNPYLIVERAPHHYIQTYRGGAEEFTVEYRDGGPDRHFGITLTTPAEVSALIWSWTSGDHAAVAAQPWARVEF
ncbi:Uncharacterised protein [Nocardia farcinica]|uniref:Uncharacterized protein n=1 Tax=Nocardia farcinica TaxID=37329 RepID=A0A449GLX8_NOCFR|nr:hypothetical protein [Nocardia farcinica]VFA93639.1 Uncharacterised protein [Nocardia farcinica]